MTTRNVMIKPNIKMYKWLIIVHKSKIIKDHSKGFDVPMTWAATKKIIVMTLQIRNLSGFLNIDNHIIMN